MAARRAEFLAERRLFYKISLSQTLLNMLQDEYCKFE
jgi:hypothetical protein